MSLGCGSCRGDIYEGFGILYKLERTSRGKLRYPNEAKDYVPANSAICDPCWRRLPASEKHAGEDAKAKAERSKGAVFAYAPADSNNAGFLGAKTCSGIVTEDEKLVFVNPQLVARYFPKAVETIDGMVKALKIISAKHRR